MRGGKIDMDIFWKNGGTAERLIKGLTGGVTYLYKMHWNKTDRLTFDISGLTDKSKLPNIQKALNANIEAAYKTKTSKPVLTVNEQNHTKKIIVKVNTVNNTITSFTQEPDEIPNSDGGDWTVFKQKIEDVNNASLTTIWGSFYNYNENGAI